MQSPELNLLIFEREREEASRRAEIAQQLPRTSVLNTIRVSAGNALVSIGTRIAQEPRPVGTRVPAGQISMAGSTRR